MNSTKIVQSVLKDMILNTINWVRFIAKHLSILINCGHTFCYQCYQKSLKKYVKSNFSCEGLMEFKCPICSIRFYQLDTFVRVNHELIQFN